MFGVGVGVRVGGFTASSGGGFDPDAQAFFDRVTTAGGTLSTTEKTATNQLVLDMKSAGIWSSMKAIYPMVGASAAACAQNLKSSSFTGTFSSGWTFASTGVTPNGTSAYCDTGFNINTQQASAQDISLGYYSGTVGGIASNSYSMGGFSPSDTSIIIRWTTNFAYLASNLGTYNNGFANTDTHGFYVSNRNTTNKLQDWKNGVKQADISNTPISKTNVNLYLGAANYGTPNYYDYKRCQFAFVGDGLSDANQGNLYTAVQAFQTTLSRQV
jgi:hypothetical protein